MTIPTEPVHAIFDNRPWLHQSRYPSSITAVEEAHARCLSEYGANVSPGTIAMYALDYALYAGETFAKAAHEGQELERLRQQVLDKEAEVKTLREHATEAKTWAETLGAVSLRITAQQAQDL